MPGSVVHGYHEGSRSEVLADYLFSSFGTVTPVRRSDDSGADLYCALTRKIGPLSVVDDYYSVQVKSSDGPWRFKSEDEIRWLVDYPTPLFLAQVNRREGVISVFATNSRFLAAWDGCSTLDLEPGESDVGQYGPYMGVLNRHSLSAPILRVGLPDLINPDFMARASDVMKAWTAIDRENCNLRRMGAARLRVPHNYMTNQHPGGANLELGSVRPPPDALALLKRTTLDAVDCLGHQLLNAGDREAALLAALLLRRFRSDDGLGRTPFEHDIAYELAGVLFPDREPAYVFEAIDTIYNGLKAGGSEFARFTTSIARPLSP